MSRATPAPIRVLLCATLGMACGNDPKSSGDDPAEPDDTAVECLTAFSWTADPANPPSTVSIVGDFNNWNSSAHPLANTRRGRIAVPPDAVAGAAPSHRRDR